MYRVMSRVALICLCLSTSTAAARTMVPGAVWLGGEVGSRWHLLTPLGGAKDQTTLAATFEYAWTSALSSTADLTLGAASTLVLGGQIGARYRLTGLQMALSPFFDAGVSATRLFDVIGANLTTAGLQIACGTDYFFTARFLLRARLGWETATTFGVRPAPLQVLTIRLGAAYAL